MFLKSDSNPKNFSLFVFDFNVSNKISATPVRLLNFQEISNPPPLVYEVLKNFLPPPTPTYLPSIGHSRVMVCVGTT